MRLLGALAAVMLAVGAATFLFWRAQPEAAPCDDRVLARVEGEGAVATAFVRTCDGAATTHVALRGVRGRDEDVFVAAGAAAVSVRFAPGAVRIDTDATRILRRESAWKTTVIKIGDSHQSSK